MDKIKYYDNPIMPSCQFVMCGNPFRADMYQGCSFGCLYCFSNYRQVHKNHISTSTRRADMARVRSWFVDALERGKKDKVLLEMLNHRTPIHLGGMADPFQKREWAERATLEFLKISRQYNYPVVISTKTGSLPDEYFKVLDPAIHTFQVSLISSSDDWLLRFDHNADSASARMNFVRELHDRGFWVAIRIQPLVDIEEALTLVQATDRYVDYYTVEHLKIPKGNAAVAKAIFPLLESLGKNYGLIDDGSKWTFEHRDKVAHINAIRAVTAVPIGCGDNDLHELSDSLNCCGVDLMPKAFDNWYRYNAMYIKMTGDRTQWRPTSNSRAVLNCGMMRGGAGHYKTFQAAVDDYYLQHYGADEQGRLFGEAG